MRRNRTTTSFALSLVALFLATQLIIQPRSLAQQQIPADEAAPGAVTPTEGQGYTTDVNKINGQESAEFPQDQSFTKEDFESGIVPIEEAGPTGDETAVQAPPNPILPGGVDHGRIGDGHSQCRIWHDTPTRVLPARPSSSVALLGAPSMPCPFRTCNRDFQRDNGHRTTR